MTRTARVVLALMMAFSIAGTATPALASEPDCPLDGCGGGELPPPPGGGGGPTYVLQGVIQKIDEAHEGAWPSRLGTIQIRGYSRLANANNDRIDADYINVRCYANVLAYSTTDYDSENNGALVDVHFWSPKVPTSGVPAASRTVTVTCSHHAEKNGVSYDTTSSAQFVIAE
ncbi:hypothetical protein [Hamadaea tsunoensis]|uniref:hypothetical protein n=1 Tax=Hamadaea tsunoensis TaxID=53368 RepID=UPI0004061743|nr:hypothetical protein [Hamadaea tsunoensis]